MNNRFIASFLFSLSCLFIIILAIDINLNIYCEKDDNYCRISNIYIIINIFNISLVFILFIIILLLVIICNNNIQITNFNYQNNINIKSNTDDIINIINTKINNMSDEDIVIITEKINNIIKIYASNNIILNKSAIIDDIYNRITNRDTNIDGEKLKEVLKSFDENYIRIIINE